jgi:hypothetical protein
MDNSKPLGTKLYSGTIYNRARGVWDFPIIQGPFSVAPCQTLANITIRNFSIAVCGACSAERGGKCQRHGKRQRGAGVSKGEASSGCGGRTVVAVGGGLVAHERFQ